ncbi:uncharacterized protein TRIVIDRAFT_203046 [Trichoderma virens Gv29-8]|uniref:Uncharacterized protein n=1 Tax=Hypocrea virens (strain Gv29-8 / FGSC 10586) TaxID=413071 RepID=G9MZ95_HYPVG|nr:uncharacterized protein TRIVIDRAFT_203046 [Trichoderma virens Gv29-8]EHK20421.1 hypothetical protein TRIVIDRAFT_203046 [Trichoderma virens Gv29-8]
MRGATAHKTAKAVDRSAEQRSVDGPVAKSRACICHGSYLSTAQQSGASFAESCPASAIEIAVSKQPGPALWLNVAQSTTAGPDSLVRGPPGGWARVLTGAGAGAGTGTGTGTGSVGTLTIRPGASSYYVYVRTPEAGGSAVRRPQKASKLPALRNCRVQGAGAGAGACAGKAGIGAGAGAGAGAGPCTVLVLVPLACWRRPSACLSFV